MSADANPFEYFSGIGKVSSFGTSFIVMTTDEVTLNRPEVCTGFAVIRQFC